MPAHMARPSPPVGGSDRARQAGFVAIALGIGLLAFAFLDGEERGGPDDPRPGLVVTTEATVLGVTVARGDALRPAGPAAPATFEVDDEPSSPTTRRAAATSTTTTTSRPGSTTTDDIDIGTPLSIDNTTTTHAPTTTTEGTTTSTSETTTPTSEP